MLGELGIERPLLVASPRWHETVDASGSRPLVGDPVRPDRGACRCGRRARRRRRLGDRHREGGVGGVGAAARVGADDVLGCGVDRLATACAPATGASSAAAPARGSRRSSTRSRLTLDLPRAETVGTALNALAHCAEALYGRRSARSDSCALAGAELIAERLPDVVGEPRDVAARTALLRGAAARGRGAGARRPRARARDRPGARRPLRTAARRHERARAPARAPLQRRGGAGGGRAASGSRSEPATTRPPGSRSWRGSGASSD